MKALAPNALVASLCSGSLLAVMKMIGTPGRGSAASDLTWQPPQADTPGAPNAGQTFVGD